MFDAPKNYDDATEWFRYFRMTKHLPGMAMKFDAEMKKVDTPEAAKRVMTSYASAALDVVFYCGFRQPNELAQELQEVFGLKPAQMMLLSVNEVAEPLKVTAEKLAERLKAGGFRISEDGIISGFDRPSAAPQPPSSPTRPTP
ncbi:MAG: hypothetical protein ACAH83_19550 [Alphaproteobacteria bacterium]